MTVNRERMQGMSFARIVNILFLIASVTFVLFYPVKKEIWYDETISMWCSKGITHDTPAEIDSLAKADSRFIQQLNKPRNVYDATIMDNGNSFLYNLGLHYFTASCGNRIETYVLFSRLWAAALLVAYFSLARLIMGDSLFILLATLLLATDLNFWSMSHEIRAYMMGTFFIVSAAYFFYKFCYLNARAMYLFLTGLFCVAAVLSHFLSVYVVLVFIGGLIWLKKKELLRPRNMIAITIPVSLIAIYFISSLGAFQVMSIQNKKIADAVGEFSLQQVAFKAMRLTAANFKLLLPNLVSVPLIILSFIAVGTLVAFAHKAADTVEKRRNINLLIILGLSGTIFQTLLCIKSQHYTALYFRYFMFCTPFCCLLTVYALSLLNERGRIHMVASRVAMACIAAVASVFFLKSVNRAAPKTYNHPDIARRIIESRVRTVEMPEWSDALLIQAMLPATIDVTYIKSPGDDFILHTDAGREVVKVIRYKI